MKCPVCRATYRPAAERRDSSTPATICRRCGVDLAPLVRLLDQAIWYHRQAIQAFHAGDYSAATAWNQQALALDSRNADFHAFAGQLAALQGEFEQAIAAWQRAQQLNPQQPIASAGLQCLMAL